MRKQVHPLLANLEQVELNEKFINTELSEWSARGLSVTARQFLIDHY